jgi:hypothetical protein
VHFYISACLLPHLRTFCQLRQPFTLYLVISSSYTRYIDLKLFKIIDSFLAYFSLQYSRYYIKLYRMIYWVITYKFYRMKKAGVMEYLKYNLSTKVNNWTKYLQILSTSASHLTMTLHALSYIPHFLFSCHIFFVIWESTRYWSSVIRTKVICIGKPISVKLRYEYLTRFGEKGTKCSSYDWFLKHKSVKPNDLLLLSEICRLRKCPKHCLFLGWHYTPGRRSMTPVKRPLYLCVHHLFLGVCVCVCVCVCLNLVHLLEQYPKMEKLAAES